MDNDGTDTIPNIVHWGHTYLWLDDEGQSRFAARKQIENDNYIFAWFEAYNYVIFNPFVCHVCFDKYAYCTVHNYPLVWGQTELVGIEEATSNAFAALHPNPTTGFVSITGENLRQAEVLNMLGQKVLSIQGEVNELRIDLAALPVGVYFVNVTDSEGRKCVQKVVKE